MSDRVAGLNVRPTHMAARDFYALPIENVRTYPVNLPDREPPGYWDMLQHVGPKRLIEPDKLITESDWIEAGRRVFEELDHFPLRTQDPRFISAARSRETFDPARTTVLADGTVLGMRRVPTKALPGDGYSRREFSVIHRLNFVPRYKAIGIVDGEQ